MSKKSTRKISPSKKPSKPVQKIIKTKAGKTRDDINKRKDRYFMLITILLILVIAIMSYLIFDYLLSFIFSANEIDPVQVENAKIKIDVNTYNSVIEKLSELKLFTK